MLFIDANEVKYGMAGSHWAGAAEQRDTGILLRAEEKTSGWSDLHCHAQFLTLI